MTSWLGLPSLPSGVRHSHLRYSLYILICPFDYFRVTFCKQYRRSKFIRVELVTILPIRSTVIATGKLDVYNE